MAAQRKNKAAIEAMLAGGPGPEIPGGARPRRGFGDLSWASTSPRRRQTKAFQKALQAEGLDTVCFKDNFWHYVPNWEHFLAKSTAQTEEAPFTDQRNRKVTYSRKAIPHAEDLLGRTLILGINVKMPAAKMKAIRQGDRESGEGAVGGRERDGDHRVPRRSGSFSDPVPSTMLRTGFRSRA